MLATPYVGRRTTGVEDRGAGMEYRRLGHSGLKVSVLTLGTMTYGGKGDFAKVGSGGAADVARAIDICADHGVNLIDTADVYSFGHCEELIGEATNGKLKAGMLIATKARFPMGKGPNDQGPLAPSSDPRLRSQPATPARGDHRSLPIARARRRHAA